MGRRTSGARHGRRAHDQPGVLLLDEPTAGLSPAAADEVFELVRSLAKSGIAVLMVEQNALLALEYRNKGLALVAGRKAREETASSLLADDEVRHLFLGRREPARAQSKKRNEGIVMSKFDRRDFLAGAAGAGSLRPFGRGRCWPRARSRSGSVSSFP